MASRSLQVIAELGVADQIADEPVEVAELAAACGADPDGPDRVLRLLAAAGIFEWHAVGYRHTQASHLLRSDHPMSMGQQRAVRLAVQREGREGCRR